MPQLSGKRALLEVLKQEGVDFMFGNPGTTELPLMDALAVADGLRYVLALQEAAVMAMADGYAQASGKLAVVSLHVTPGLGNAMGMLYDAQKAGSPILVTAGQHDQDFSVTEPILWADLPTLARPLVKWSSEVHRLADLPRLVHRAVKTALAPPTGPVFLSLPADVLKAEGEVDLGAPTRVAPRLRGDREALAAAAALLAKAERPLVIAGDAVAQGRALPEIVALAEMLGAPVYAELIPARRRFPASHPLFRGTMPRLQPQVRAILEQHDLLFSVGGDLFRDVAAVTDRDGAARLQDHSSRHRSVGAGQELSGRGRDPRRSQGDLARSHRDARRADGRGRARPRARSGSKRPRKRISPHARRCARGHAAMPASARCSPWRCSRRWDRCCRRDAVVIDETISSGAGLRQLIAGDDAQSLLWAARRRHRLGPAGDDRREARAAASVRSSASSATAARCTPARRCGRPRTSAFPPSG